MKAFAISLLLSLGVFANAFQSPMPDTSTPDRALQAFLNAWTTGDAKTAIALVIDVKETPEILANVQGLLLPKLGLKGSDMQVIQSGTDAAVIYQLQTYVGNNMNRTGQDIVQLAKTSEGWRIVPPKGEGQPTYLGVGLFARMIADPELMKRVAVAESQEVCGGQIREVGLAVLLWASDHDDKVTFAASQAAFRTAIEPYLKNMKKLECPSAPGTVAYSFNVKLVGMMLADVGFPSQTIMVYEGEKGKLNFRHNGRAAVCFVDGHVQLVDEAEAKNLQWEGK